MLNAMLRYVKTKISRDDFWRNKQKKDRTKGNEVNNLGETKGTLEAPPELLAHGSPGVLGTERGLLVLTGPAEQKVQALGSSAPGHALDNLGLLVSLHGLVLNQGLGDFIGHTLELGICQTRQLLRRRGEHLRGTDLLSSFDGSQVVSCKDNVHLREGCTGCWCRNLVGPLLADDSIGDGIVVGVGFGLGIKGEVLGL